MSSWYTATQLLDLPWLPGYRLWMATWRRLRENQKLLPSDVLHWAERAWTEIGRGKRKRALLAGARDVRAEVMHMHGNMVTLKVQHSAPGKKVLAGPIELPKKGEIIRRKIETILKGEGHRLLWSDESARAIVASRFLGPEPAPPKAGAALRPGNWRPPRSGSGTARRGSPRGRAPRPKG